MGTFMKFLTDDPIMLGLCIAIVVLIIMFIVVLVLGKRKDSKNSKLNNTSELLKTEINLEALDNTREYSATENKPMEEPVVKVAETEPVVTPTEAPTIEIPVETKTEPTKLETEVPKFENPAENEIPEIFTFGIDGTKKIEELVDALSGFPAPEEFKSEPAPIIESKVEPVIAPETPIVESTNNPSPTFPNFKDPSPIIESTVNPIDENDFHGADSLIDFTTPEENVVENFMEIKEESTAENPQSFEPFNFGFNNDISTPNIFDVPAPVETPSPKEEPVEEPTNFEPVQEEIKNNVEQMIIVDPKENGIFDHTVTFPKVETPASFEPVLEEQDESDTDGEVKEMDPYNSIYMNTQNIELPGIQISDFSKTAIMKHIPIMESMPNNLDKIDLEKNSKSNSSEDSELDDVDLPKLNPSEDTNSAFRVLQGESFNIE